MSPSFSAYTTCDSWGCAEVPAFELIIKSKRANSNATEVYCAKHTVARQSEIRATSFLKLKAVAPVNVRTS